MEIRQLRYFVALAEELHFARAASRVGIEQSPLSKAITDMERDLGVKLFIRTRRSTSLTSVGELLLTEARQILAGIDRARQKLKAAASGRSGTLRLAVCDGIGHPRIAKLLSEVHKDTPTLDIQLVHHPWQEQLRHLQSGLIDIGFGLSHSTDPEIQVTPLWRDSVVVVMSIYHRLAISPSIKTIPHDAGRLIQLGDCCRGSSNLSSRDRQPRHQREGEIELVESTEFFLTLVAARLGIGLMSEALAEAISRPDIAVRPLEDPSATVTTFIYGRRKGGSPIAAQFLERALKVK